MRRDRLTFATMITIPVMQLILFGFAINSDPKHLPTAVLDNDHSAYSRLFMTALKATDYFDMRYTLSGSVRDRRQDPVRRGQFRSSRFRRISRANWRAAKTRRSSSSPTPPTRPQSMARKWL